MGVHNLPAFPAGRLPLAWAILQKSIWPCITSSQPPGIRQDGPIKQVWVGHQHHLLHHRDNVLSRTPHSTLPLSPMDSFFLISLWAILFLTWTPVISSLLSFLYLTISKDQEQEYFVTSL